MTVSTWRSLIEEEKKARGDTTPIVDVQWVMSAIEPNGAEASLDVHIDGPLESGPGGQPFVAWTEKRVYFSLFYDGYGHYVKSVPRDPCENVQKIAAGGWNP